MSIPIHYKEFPDTDTNTLIILNSAIFKGIKIVWLKIVSFVKINKEINKEINKDCMFMVFS